ncbi:glycosyltransferase [Sphingomonas sp.]|uniref:glycosyltransferase family 2 protein n=1 Tax=Sphingomonas sp. TaxID=28214 RepID=UPI00333F5A3A
MSAPHNPAISVLMATYNGAGLVGETIASLQAQSFTDFELIVVDDCSTDATVAVVEAFADPRIRVIRSPVNRRVVLTRNAAFAAARGRYIAALDHDDLCHPDRFARQIAYLDAHPEIVLVGTAANVLSEGAILPSSLAPLSTPPVIEWLLRIENPLVWSSVMLRADAARRLDPFQRPEMVYAEDFDLYHRISAYGGIARLDDELMTYRRHGGGASQVQAEAMRGRAADVLAEVYAPLFGDVAADTARLIVTHVMSQQPVPDRATLAAVGDALVRLQDDFLAQRRPDSESRSLIRWETARRWARIGRAGLRTGTLKLGDATAVRPAHLGLGYAGIEELILSRLVGSVRVAQRRLAKRDAA